jgi:hypothetical protein
MQDFGPAYDGFAAQCPDCPRQRKSIRALARAPQAATRL